MAQQNEPKIETINDLIAKEDEIAAAEAQIDRAAPAPRPMPKQPAVESPDDDAVDDEIEGIIGGDGDGDVADDVAPVDAPAASPEPEGVRLARALAASPTIAPPPKPIPPSPAPLIDPSDPEVHECGLPVSFLDHRFGRSRIGKYLRKHGYGQAERKQIVYTQAERNRFAMYRAAVGRQFSPKDFFVAALRLFQAGYPLGEGGKTDINRLSVKR